MRPRMLVVSAAIAPLNAEPRAGSEQLSQALAGHPLVVLEEAPPWLRVRGRDEYEGWVHRGYVAPLSAREQRRRFDAGRISLGCIVREIDGRRRALPLGAIVSDDAFVEDGIVLGATETSSRFARTPEAIARSAVELFEGTPYQWGGVTPWGADCSGLVQTCFSLHGVALPRDAWQQGTMGEEAGADLSALRAGDLLFFSDRPEGRVTHVAIALGEMRLVHLALGRGGYAVERLDDDEDSYVRALVERFRFARRLKVRR